MRKQSMHQAFAALVLLIGSVAASAGPVVVANPALAGKPAADDIKAIFLGQSSALPGAGAVTPGLPKDGKVREDFLSGFVGKSNQQYKAVWTQLIFTGKAQAPKQFENDDELKKWIAATPNSIGVLDSSKVDGTVKVISGQ
ncbi:hypothetical protein ABT392_04405 [Paucibacter sp. JuS9]|uniref:hypothetical protein n=1 Tax=Roseateles TaxID=93681 RepID=UPI002FE5225A